MLKFGIELEAFLVDKDNKPVLVPQCLPQDDCGFLVEFRGKPSTSIRDAVASVIAERWMVEDRIASTRELIEYGLLLSPTMVVGRDVRDAARRIHSKGVVRERNLYKYTHHRNKQTEATAGLHISFTNPCNRHVGDNKFCEYNSMFDFPHLFRCLDEEFAETIKGAKRNPGFYELKDDGRVEYRSLPCTVDLRALINSVEHITRTEKL